MTYDLFVEQLSKLNEAFSITGKAKYDSICISNDRVEYVREKTGNKEFLLLSELFEFAKKESAINTIIARDYISGRKYSPACAILIAAGVCEYLKE
ncbi:hypothetical protein [Marinifilum sp.]|uniref:hypothetical protein n=1 Tax=Marinifilum sp. TaxID=2033137 RepID=UPI003BACB8A3